jgi:hypothetical protein
METERSWYHGLFRMWPAWIASALLLGLIYYVQPQQIGVLLYKTFFITWGALTGYWVDRWLAPNDRPHLSTNPEAAELRRCYVVCASMLSFALAV